MTTLTTRSGKGSALTHAELDTNFDKGSQAKVGAYTVAESDNRDTIECSGTFTISLPDATTVLAASDTGDFEVTIKNTGSGVITVDRVTGLDTIDGVASSIDLIENETALLKANQAGNGYIISNKSVGSLSRSSVITGAAATSISVGPLSYPLDKAIEFEAYIIGAAIGNVYLELNSDTTIGNYFSSYSIGNATPISGNNPDTGMILSTVNDYAINGAIIPNSTTGESLVILSIASRSTGAVGIIECSIAYTVNDTITSIGFYDTYGPC